MSLILLKIPANIFGTTTVSMAELKNDKNIDEMINCEFSL